MTITAIAIDDEPLALDVIKTFCDKVDYIDLKKTFTETGDALKYLETNKVDLLFLDINMPKMNGVEFLRALRNDEALKDLKVFVITTSGQESDRRAMQELGVSEYLIKPLNFTDNNKRADSMDAFMQFHIRKLLTQNPA